MVQLYCNRVRTFPGREAACTPPRHRRVVWKQQLFLSLFFSLFSSRFSRCFSTRESANPVAAQLQHRWRATLLRPKATLRSSSRRGFLIEMLPHLIVLNILTFLGSSARAAARISAFKVATQRQSECGKWKSEGRRQGTGKCRSIPSNGLPMELLPLGLPMVYQWNRVKGLGRSASKS